MHISSYLSLDDLRLFYMVSTSGGISAACKNYGYSKARFSRAIVRLEDQCGTVLFNRTHSGLELTPTGKTLLDNARLISELGSEIEQDLRAAKKEPAGPIRIAASATSARFFVGPVIARLRDLYPKIQPHISVTSLGPNPQSENLDVVLRLGMPNDPNLVAKKITTTRFKLFTSPVNKHFQAPMNGEQVDALGRIVINVQSSPQIWHLTNAEGKSITLDSKPIALVEDPVVATSIVQAGNGVVFLPDFFTAPQISHGMLQPILEDYSGEEISFYACYPPQRSTVPAVRAFLDILKEYTESIVVKSKREVSS
nr:LysR family transcriptional regulator [Pseudovibrio stylochi]